MLGHRGIWSGGWKAVTHHERGTLFDDDRWELYHLDGDFSECRNLAEAEPERLKEMVDLWWREAEQHGVTTVDLLGPLIAKVAQRLHSEPRHQPGLLHGFTDEYFRRVEAVEFAVRHDDGANVHTLPEADIVLTGVSRTSKTPLSMYLAQRGYKTGNVPIIPGIDTHRALLDLDRRKVFALSIDPSLLLTIRQARVRTLGAPPYSTYANPEALLEEVRRARGIYRDRGWRVIDVSGRAVEENAARILRFVEGDAM